MDIDGADGVEHWAVPSDASMDIGGAVGVGHWAVPSEDASTHDVHRKMVDNLLIISAPTSPDTVAVSLEAFPSDLSLESSPLRKQNAAAEANAAPHMPPRKRKKKALLGRRSSRLSSVVAPQHLPKVFLIVFSIQIASLLITHACMYRMTMFDDCTTVHTHAPLFAQPQQAWTWPASTPRDSVAVSMTLAKTFDTMKLAIGISPVGSWLASLTPSSAEIQKDHSVKDLYERNGKNIGHYIADALGRYSAQWPEVILLDNAFGLSS